MLTRRTTIAALAGLAAIGGARAQSFPSRTITLVVPYPAGGPVDITARLIAQSAGHQLGQPIAVDNRGGGAGVIGSVAVQHAEPDGHMLILGTNQTHATNQSLLKDCPYDAVRDFSPVASIAEIAHVLVVRRGLEVANVGALVALARKSAGGLNYASTGVGSASHLAAELFKTKAGVDLQHIPFRGSAPMATELLAGRIDLTFATVPSVIAHIGSGAVRPLAIASGKRSSRLPDLPTLAEAGVPGVEADAWFALFAPARTPAAAIERIFSAVSAGLSTDAASSAISAQGMTKALRSPSELSAWLPAEVAKWAAVIRAAGVSAL
ncbi:MAG: tripartite tricarboxylate transporter substrate binding protein [Hyphomicrobiales bacterium]